MQKNWREGAARLRAMPWDEFRLRFRQEAGKRIDRLIYGLGFSLSSLELKPARKPVQLNSRPAGAGAKVPAVVRGSGQFFFSTPEVQPILAIMRQRFAEESAKILQRAERICCHQFDLLGFENVDYGKEIDWLLDPVHQERWPRLPWYQLCKNECGDGGAQRIVLEINRHQHLVTLAKALLLAQEPRFLTELLDQWRSWQRENRYPMGINWSSSHEVALRSLAWLWVGHLLSASTLAPKSFQAELLRGLAENGRRIERYLDLGGASRIAEAAGLFFIGTLCPRLRSAARWQDLGWRLIQEEAQKRVRADGMHRDESVYYHVYALDFFLHCRLLAWSNGIPIPEFLDRTIVQMLELLSGISQAGFPPRFGDDDGGRVLDGARNRAEHMLDPLSTGAVLYERADFKSASRGLTEETLWLLGPEAASRFDAIPALPVAAASAAFRESGLYVMTAGQTPRPATNAGARAFSPQIVIRARTGNGGAHAHHDALSVHLSAGGEEWLVDPGTFTFNSGSAHSISGGSSAPERYSGAAAHNRLVVDGENPLGAAGGAVLPAGEPPLWAAGRQFDLFRGTEDGPGGDGKPIVRERWVFQLKSEFWLVRDLAIGSDEHELELYWRFSPHFTPSYTPPGFTLVRRAKEGEGAGLAVIPAEGHGWSQEILRGFVSPVYGREDPAPVVCFRTRAHLPAELAVVLAPSGASAVGRGVLKREDAGGVTCYCYAREGSLYWLFFPQTAGPWECGEWQSDARFLCLGSTPLGASLAVVSGSYLGFRGRPVLVSDRAVAQFEVTPEGQTVFSPDAQATFELRALKAAIDEAARGSSRGRD